MTWPLLIATHAFAAAVAVPLGAWQLFLSTKGDGRHRVAGRVWAVLLLYVSVTSFWIRDLRHGEFSFLHVLSVVTIITVSLGVWSARNGHVELHKRNMRGSWLGLMGAFITALVIPQRLIPTFFVTEPAQATAAAVTVLLTTAAVLAAAGRLGQPGETLAQRRMAS